jgi:hypothetical protein
MERGKSLTFPTFINLILSVPILDENWYPGSRAVTNMIPTVLSFPLKLGKYPVSSSVATHLVDKNDGFTPLLQSWYQPAALWNGHSESLQVPATEPPAANSSPD